MKQRARAAWRRVVRLGRIGRVAAAMCAATVVVMAAWALLSWEDNLPDQAARRGCLSGLPRSRPGLHAQGCPSHTRPPPTVRMAGARPRPVSVGHRRGHPDVRGTPWRRGAVESVVCPSGAHGGADRALCMPAAAGRSREGAAKADGARRRHRRNVLVRRLLGVRAAQLVRRGHAADGSAHCPRHRVDVDRDPGVVAAHGPGERHRPRGGCDHDRDGRHRQCVCGRSRGLSQRGSRRPDPGGGFRHAGVRGAVQRQRAAGGEAGDRPAAGAGVVAVSAAACGGRRS